LIQYVFVNRNFWNTYYDYKMQYKEVQSIVLNRWMNEEDIQTKISDEYKFHELKRTVTRMIYGKEDVINWHMPEKVEDFFECNYKRYSYYRCYVLLMDIFWRKEERGFYYNTGYTKYFPWEMRLKEDVKNIFRQWISLANDQNICMSLYKEVFITILSESRKYKEEQLVIYVDDNSGAYSIRKGEEEREKIFIDSIKKFDSVNKKWLKTYFHPLYESRIDEKNYVDLRRFMKNKNARICRFSRVIDELYEFMDGLPAFECYMIENKIGILSAWECYNSFYEIYNLFSKDEEIKHIIEELVASIAKVHNLELRLYIIRSIDKIVKDVMASVQIDLKTALEIISEQIKMEAKYFNEIYERMLDVSVYLFCEKNRWENIMWIKNFLTEEVTRVMKRFIELKSSDAEQTYVKRKFNDLYYADSNKPKHIFFTNIWKAIQASDKYNVFEQYKEKDSKK